MEDLDFSSNCFQFTPTFSITGHTVITTSLVDCAKLNTLQLADHSFNQTEHVTLSGLPKLDLLHMHTGALQGARLSRDANELVMKGTYYRIP